MRHKLPFILACILAVASAAAAVSGEATYTRAAVQRTDQEKDFILDQMRLLLGSIVEVEDGLGSGDLDQVAREAAARGRKANANLPKPSTLSAKESDAWKAMFGSVRTGFDTIAEKAKARAPASEINKTLADTMRNCVACHQTYRIEVQAH